MISKNTRLTRKIFNAICLGISSFALVTPAAIAETFSIGGMALNTNAQFPLKDGHPIMSIWPLANGDRDQQFDRRNGDLLQHSSTGKCLNAYQPAPGSKVNVYPCNSNDGDQKFAFISVGNNTNLIKRIGTNLCLDMPSRSPNTPMILWECNTGNANQQFVSNAGSSSPPAASNPDISIRLTFNGNFTTAQKNSILKAAKNWEDIITSDMVPGGVLTINVTDDLNSSLISWAETNFPSISPGQLATPRQRNNLSGQYSTNMKIRRSFLNGPNSWQLTKLATHEIGHALYLDEASYDTSLGTNGIMNIYPLNPAMTEGIYRRLEYLGYKVNRNSYPQW
jgi:Ricin-type beta-trefoil lectin domain